MTTSASSSSFAERHPIHTEADLKKAIQVATTAAERKHTRQRATAIGHAHLIPSHWARTDAAPHGES